MAIINEMVQVRFFFTWMGQEKTVFTRIYTKGNPKENIRMNTRVYCTAVCAHFHSIAYKSLTEL